jgi:hypothetical protein
MQMAPCSWTLNFCEGAMYQMDLDRTFANR